MKITQFTNYQLESTESEMDICSRKGICLIPTPGEVAVRILLLALKTINQAGLDGKELNNIRLIRKFEIKKHYDDQVVEIHADVKHRLKHASSNQR